MLNQIWHHSGHACDFVCLRLTNPDCQELLNWEVITASAQLNSNLLNVNTVGTHTHTDFTFSFMLAAHKFKRYT